MQFILQAYNFLLTDEKLVLIGHQFVDSTCHGLILPAYYPCIARDTYYEHKGYPQQNGSKACDKGAGSDGMLVFLVLCLQFIGLILFSQFKRRTLLFPLLQTVAEHGEAFEIIGRPVVLPHITVGIA